MGASVFSVLGHTFTTDSWMTARPARSRPLRRAAVATALVVLAAPVLALRPATRVYRASDGLPHSRVTAVAQDGDGFLWVATYRGGLARYDGVRFRVLGPADGLPSRNVDFVAASPEGDVFATTPAGWGRVRGERFETLPSPEPGLPPGTLLPVSAREVWLGTERGAWLFREGLPPQHISLGAQGATQSVWGFAREKNGCVLIAARAGLFRACGETSRVAVPVPGLPPGEVSAVAVLSDGEIAVATGSAGLLRSGPTGFHRLASEPSRFSALAAGPDGVIFAGTSGQGPWRCDAAECAPITARGFDPEAVVFDIFLDRDGVAWFATDDGLLKRSDSAFETLEPPDGFPDPLAVYGTAETRDGSLWFAGGARGLLRLAPSGAVRVFTSQEGLPPGTVTHVFASEDGNSAYVTTRGGLGRISGDRVERIPVPGLPSVDLNVGGAVGGSLYLGTWADGLLVVRDGRATRLDSSLGREIQWLAPARSSRMLCASEKGVFILQGERVIEHIDVAAGLPTARARFVMEDSAGALWVGTESGVWTRDREGRSRVWDRRAGLPDDFISWIAETPDRAHWFGTNAGVVRLAPGGSIAVFGANDGLPGPEASVGGGFVDSRGRLFAGTTALSRLRDWRAASRVAPPVVVLDAATPAGPLRRPAEVRLPAGRGPLTFRFASPSYLDEEGTRYRTRLLGFDDAWRLTDYRETTATFGGLPAGDYVFEVEALTGGRASATPGRVRVIVEPRVWERPGMRVAAFLLIAAMVAVVMRARERLARQRERELARLVEARTEELRNANQRLAEMAATDALTGLPNRRAMEDALREAVARARRKPPLAVALIDLDGFKALNDRFGHEKGDECLRAAAHQLRTALREGDTLGRWGGDEFLALFPGSDIAGARLVADRMAGPIEPLEGMTLSFSTGLAALRADDADAASLLRRADGALYAAKGAGRNRIEAAE